MTERSIATDSPDWFRALLDTADEVYFRYALEPARGFVDVSPSVIDLTGQAAGTFYDDPSACVKLLAREDRRLVGQVLRARRNLTLTLHLQRGDHAIQLDLRTVPIIRDRRVVAIEGVARVAARTPGARDISDSQVEPTQARLAALMYKVHELLHRVLPPGQRVEDGSVRVVTVVD